MREPLMLHRPVGSVFIRCDTCPNALDCETNQWTDAWSLAQDKGWSASNTDDGAWMRYCPRCTRRREHENPRADSSNQPSVP
jgi:hypothetical protein